MSVFGWSMMALGLFLVLYTVAFVVRSNGSKGRNSLGCGFVLLAGLVWSIALTQYVGSSSAGMRLGFGAALILPALTTLFRAGRRRLVPAALCFVAGLLLASSALPALKERIKPSKARVEARDMTRERDALQAQFQKRASHLESLRKAEARLTSELKALRVTDFEAAMAVPESRRVIEELSEVKRLCKSEETILGKERAALKRLESELRRAERLAQSDALARDEIEAALPGEEAVTSPATVEDYAAREEMRALFEKTRE